MHVTIQIFCLFLCSGLKVYLFLCFGWFVCVCVTLITTWCAVSVGWVGGRLVPYLEEGVPATSADRHTVLGDAQAGHPVVMARQHACNNGAQMQPRKLNDQSIFSGSDPCFSRLMFCIWLRFLRVISNLFSCL